ncbi:redox-regulated ATPase YchF [Candidatus Microgenomates bacterium]|nr:MAG: redox-regulated ATPase YchF [Candidatus Microgenomates bacterium]
MSSSKLAVGIVGLPNVGKSTLFNALLRKQQAFAANYPFATIDPNIGIVPVPDARLAGLAETVKIAENMDSLPPEVPATVEFVDIAGLIAGAHKGEGLGNKFLSHIRETDAICHVVRAFENEEIVRHESVPDINPKRDLEIVEMELTLADLQTIEKQREPKGNADREELERWEVVKKIRPVLEGGGVARDAVLDEDEQKIAKSLGLLTLKPILVVLNVSEDELMNTEGIEADFAAKLDIQKKQVIAISARTEEQLAALSDEESSEYLIELGVAESGLARLINSAFNTLGLITFLTAGEKEVRAWTIKNGTNAQNAAGVIHNDFVKKFIKADVVNFDDFVEGPGWKACREAGKVRSEGKDYVVKNGDVVEFKIGS